MVGHGGGVVPSPTIILKMQEEKSIEEQNEEFFSSEPIIEKIKTISFKNAFWVVVAFHLIVVIGIMTASAKPKAMAQDDAKVLNEPIPDYVGVDYPTPTPEPTPIPTPTPKAITIYPEKTNPNYPQITKEYVVRQGDTFYSIVRRYKLDANKLIKLNNIKDPNKIQIGQKLKFM